MPQQINKMMLIIRRQNFDQNKKLLLVKQSLLRKRTSSVEEAHRASSHRILSDTLQAESSSADRRVGSPFPNEETKKSNDQFVCFVVRVLEETAQERYRGKAQT